MRKIRRFINKMAKDHALLFWLLLITNPILMTLYTVFTISELIRGVRLGKRFERGEISLGEMLYETMN